MVMTVEGGKRFSQTDEADGKRAVFQHFSQIVLEGELVGIQPDALAHQEGVVINVLAGLNFKAIQQLLCHQFQHPLKLFVEQRFVAVAFDGQTGQVDGGEGQVAPGVGDLPGGS